MKLILTRHGESEGNKKKLIQGHADYPLTDKGLKQASELTAWLKSNKYTISRIYSSDLSRAAETAVIIAKGLGNKDIIFDQRLREFNLGDFEHKSYDKLSQEERKFMDSHWENEDKKMPNGESVTDMKKRIKESFDDIIPYHKEEETVLIVAHGGTLFHIVISTLGFDIRKTLDEEWFDNCKITELIFDIDANKWSLITFNSKPFTFNLE
ncbi:MAG: histidine phosphatase family protein [Asgard group archaeon]|nr:histidine phosphatase family protein [Asgard group archaeon]